MNGSPSSVVQSPQGMVYHNHYYYPSMSVPVNVSTKADKFTLPAWNPKDMKWSEFFSKIATVLHKHKMEHLLFSMTTDVSNQEHSSKLCYELYEKLLGSSLAPFNLLDAHSYYLQGGCGVEMILALCHKFNSLTFEWIMQCSSRQDSESATYSPARS